MTTANEYNKARLDAGKIPPEAITALTLLYQKTNELDDDGKLGPATIEKLVPKKSDPDYTNAAWPLRKLKDGRIPAVTSAFRPKERPLHTGNDMFYRYLYTDPPMKIGDSGRTAKWWIPEGTKAVAVRGGTVVAANMIGTGYRVKLDIGGGLVAHYIHLAKLDVKVGDKVVVGNDIGTVGDNPIDYDADHLHFGLTLNGELIDPQRLLYGAAFLPPRV